MNYPPGITSLPVEKLYQFFWVALDWLYPPFCAGCNQPGSLWCTNCQTASHPFSQKLVCAHCGQLLRSSQRICTSCRNHPPPYVAMRSWAAFSGPLREAIHSLKYRQNMGLGAPLALHLIDLLQQLNWQFDLIVPVPLSSQRLAERGYNQASLLARPIAFALHKPFLPQALLRIRNTASQVGLSSAERKINVHGAFTAKPSRVSHRSILLVDDVTTTGATLAACTQALLDAGAHRVYALTLARANFKKAQLGGG